MNRRNGIIVCALIIALSGYLSIPVLAKESKPPVDTKTYLADISALLKKKWPANRTVNIVCHGNSVPAGYFNTPVVEQPNAYPHLLFMGLADRFPFAVVNVIVTAVGGENSESGAARFEKDVLSHTPDVIFIDYALNDRIIGLKRTKHALTSMITKAKKRKIKVILLTPTPELGANLDNANDPLNQQAELIRAIAKEHQVGLVDSLVEFQSYVKNGGNLSDLMSRDKHPNRKGHDLVVKKLLEWFPQ